jgi:hypothetical protein
MQQCELSCGTGDVIMEGILNASCQNMVIQAGEGSLTLRFKGKELLKNIKVSIRASTGIINITLLPHIPSRITITDNKQVIVGEGIIKNDSFTDSGVYETAAYRDAAGNTIEIEISGGSGPIYLNPPV